MSQGNYSAPCPKSGGLSAAQHGRRELESVPLWSATGKAAQDRDGERTLTNGGEKGTQDLAGLELALGLVGSHPSLTTPLWP